MIKIAPQVTADGLLDLDVRIVNDGIVVADLLAGTGDGCGETCQSACSNSTC